MRADAIRINPAFAISDGVFDCVSLVDGCHLFDCAMSRIIWEYARWRRKKWDEGGSPSPR